MSNNQQPTAEWWESHMGNTIPEEYRKWGCDAAKMMSEEIAEPKAQLKIAKEALYLCLHELKKSNIPECIDLEKIETILNSALSKLSI